MRERALLGEGLHRTGVVPVPSNFRCEGDLDSLLKQQGVPGLWGIDTRRLTKSSVRAA